MKELRPTLIHIGLPKTATSTIQHLLRNDDRINLIKNLYFNTPDYWCDDFAFCKKNKINVLSEENLIVQSANRGKLYMTLSRMAKIAPDAIILVTIREQRSMMLSRYKYNIPYWDGFTHSIENWLKTGQGMDYLSMCMYGSLFKTINSFFPVNQIQFMHFEALKDDYNGFFEELYNLIGITVPDNINDKTKRNITRSDQELLLIKKFNKFKIFRKGGYLSQEEARYIKRIAMKFSNKNNNHKIFNWGESDYFKKIEKDFLLENKIAIELGVLKLEDLKKFGYLL